MSAAILVPAVVSAQFALALAMVLAAFRMIRGPRAQDRVLGLDALYVAAMLFFLTLGIGTGTVNYTVAQYVGKPKKRTGTMTVAERTVTIQQSK